MVVTVLKAVRMSALPKIRPMRSLTLLTGNRDSPNRWYVGEE